MKVKEFDFEGNEGDPVLAPYIPRDTVAAKELFTMTMNAPTAHIPDQDLLPVVHLRKVSNANTLAPMFVAGYYSDRRKLATPSPKNVTYWGKPHDDLGDTQTIDLEARGPGFEVQLKNISRELVYQSTVKPRVLSVLLNGFRQWIRERLSAQ